MEDLGGESGKNEANLSAAFPSKKDVTDVKEEMGKNRQQGRNDEGELSASYPGKTDEGKPSASYPGKTDEGELSASYPSKKDKEELTASYPGVIFMNRSNNKWGKLKAPIPEEKESFYTSDFEEDFEEVNLQRNKNQNDKDVARQIDKTNAESLAATKNMVMLMEEGRDAGYRTQTNLYSQGEKLKGVEDNLDRMASDMDEAEGHLDEMEGRGCCGVGKKKKKKKKNNEKNKKNKKKFQYTGVGSGNDEDDRTDNFGYVTGDAKEKQMADNLALVDDILDEMDYMADDLNREIVGQNKRVERIQEKGKQNKEQLGRLNEKADRVAKGKKAPDQGGNMAGNIAASAVGM